MPTTYCRALGTAFLTLMAAPFAAAQTIAEDLPVIGQPVPSGTGFQPAATELARDLQWLDGMILVIITCISLFVTALLGIVIWRFRQGRNETPATFTHNSPLEIAWTVIPVLILVFIGSFSLPTLFKQQVIPEADVTIKETGYQRYWGYEYVDHEFAFDSFMIGYGEGNFNESISAQLAEAGYSDEHFLLAVDNAVVVPVDQTIVMQVTGGDVIHSWTIPSFGVKQDAVPGRLAELWFRAEEEGIYFGQCSELCGKDHAYMPITVKVASQETYETWLEEAVALYAGDPTTLPGYRVARN